MRTSNTKRLLVSIHDVAPHFEVEISMLLDIIKDSLGGAYCSMLVVPDYWGENPIKGNRKFSQQLKTWSDSGIEMFVHGWYHLDVANHIGANAMKARFMTASEGEFLGLSAAEASARMNAGKQLIEGIIERNVSGFVAPAWLYGNGAMEALSASDMLIAEDHMRVWRPGTGHILAKGPVVTWASRSALRTASSIAFAALARLTLGPMDTVRVALHPGDVTKPKLLASISKTLHKFARQREVGRYCDLLN